MIGTRAPSTMPAASALAMKVRFLASMLPASRSGTTRICARPATSDLMPLIRAASGSIALSKASGPSRIAAGDLAAIGHLAQRRRLDRRRYLRGHRLDRRKDRDARRAQADLREQVDRVLDDVALGVEIGKDVDGGIGDEQGFGIGRNVHDEDVADPPRSAQPGGGRGDRAHEFVGVQAALHQELALCLLDQLHRLRCRLVAVRRIDKFETRRCRGRAGFATAPILPLGPTRIGTIRPASAASSAPRNEVSSQGCTTIVLAGGTCLARAIRRSYFA